MSNGRRSLYETANPTAATRRPSFARASAGRSTYHITEPLLTFYEAVMRPSWTMLEQRQRTSHEVDVIALGEPPLGGGPRPLLCLGEAKWGEAKWGEAMA